MFKNIRNKYKLETFCSFLKHSCVRYYKEMIKFLKMELSLRTLNIFYIADITMKMYRIEHRFK